MKKFLRRPSAAIVVAVAALVWATCGSAIADGANAVVSALKPNSVTSKTVKNGSLLLKDFKASERAKLVGPQGPAGTPNGYTKTEADAAFLAKAGKAADADKLDGKDSSEFITGAGAQGSNYQLATPPTTNASFLTLPQLGTISADCAAGPVYNINYVNNSGGLVRWFTEVTSDGGSPALDAGQTADGVTKLITGGGIVGRTFTLQFQRTTGIIFFTTYTAVVHLTAITGPAGDAGKCRFQGEVTSNTAHSGGLIFLPLFLKNTK